MKFVTEPSDPADDHAAKLYLDRLLPHLDDAFCFACWISGDRTAAEEIVHRSYRRAYTDIRELRGNDRVWIMTIVSANANEWLQEQGRQALEPAGDAQLTDHAASEPQRLCSAISRLEPVLRESLVLRELGGFDYCEIARITGVPPGTVVARLAKARFQLTCEEG